MFISIQYFKIFPKTLYFIYIIIIKYKKMHSLSKKPHIDVSKFTLVKILFLCVSLKKGCEPLYNSPGEKNESPTGEIIKADKSSIFPNSW